VPVGRLVEPQPVDQGLQYGTKPSQLLEAADNAMYGAKQDKKHASIVQHHVRGLLDHVDAPSDKAVPCEKSKLAEI
jgi:hypothetical protein